MALTLEDIAKQPIIKLPESEWKGLDRAVLNMDWPAFWDEDGVFALLDYYEIKHLSEIDIKKIWKELRAMAKAKGFLDD